MRKLTLFRYTNNMFRLALLYPKLNNLVSFKSSDSKKS